MSRIGNKPVVIPEKVEVSIKDMSISVKGPKGELSTTIIDERIVFEIKENVLTFSRTSEDKVVKIPSGGISAHSAQCAMKNIPLVFVQAGPMDPWAPMQKAFLDALVLH